MTFERSFANTAPEITSEGPRPLVRATPEGEPYPVDALGPLKRAVVAVQGQTLAPIAIAAQSALSIASLAVQGFADVETLAGRVPMSLFCLTIAKSGERKSACDKPLMKGLEDFEYSLAEDYQIKSKDYEKEFSLWKTKRDAFQRAAAGRKPDRRTEAEADLNKLGDQPEQPLMPDRTVTEPTYEGLTRLFQFGQPSLGIFSDEGGQFLGGHGMSADNRQKTMTALSDLWGGNAIKRTRQGDGSFALYSRRLAIHLMVQPIIADDFLSDPLASGQGFLPRFLITQPPSEIGNRFQKDVKSDPIALQEFATKLKCILDTKMPTKQDGRTLKPRVLTLSSGARQLLSEYSDVIEREQGGNGSLSTITAYASKSMEQSARIAGVLTLWGDIDAQTINTEAMQRGITLGQFYLSEAKRLADNAVISTKTKEAETLRKWLLEEWDDSEILVADVVQRGPNSLRESPKAKSALKILADSDWLQVLPEDYIVRGKKRKLAYQVVRAHHVV